MRSLTLLLLPLLGIPALAQPDVGGPKQNFGEVPRQAPLTPAQQVEGTVRGFFMALNGDNVYFQSLDFVADLRDVGYFGGPRWATQWQKDRGTLRLDAEKFEIVELKENTAKAKVTYSWRNTALGVRTQSIVEELNLRIGPAYSDKKPRWQIVAPATLEEALEGIGVRLPGAMPVQPDNLPVLNVSAGRIATPRVSWQLIDNRNDANEALAQQSLSHLKQLGLAALMFTQDFDETFAFAPQFYKDALLPYLKNADVFTIPEVGESYTFNGNLSALSLEQLKTPTQTVLFYEGQDEKPTFRYNGRAAILFADGHVKLMTPDETKNLIWKP